MRKRIGAVALAFITLFCLTACKDDLGKYDANISELRTNLYAAESGTLRASAITGRRENPFVLDGNSGEKRDFTVVTVVPNPFTAGKVYRYKAEIDGTEYTGDFLPHPFAESYSCDIPVAASADRIPLTVTCEGADETLTLVSQVTPDTITADKALSIALSRLAEPLKSLKTGGRLCAEIYVRLTENPIDNTGGYFWYVAFVGESQQTYAVLLASATGEIVAVRD